MDIADHKDDEAAACREALFLTDPLNDRDQLLRLKGSRVDGTCEWILTNEMYVSWRHSRSSLLWISGGPGKGKTMLSIFLTQHFEHMAIKNSNINLLQYFCDNKDEKRRNATAVIRSLILQLLQVKPELHKYILPSYKVQKQNLFSSSSFDTLWRAFEGMVRDPITGTAYCILDGLDECEESSAELLLEKFQKLFIPPSTCYLNLIILSRDFPDIFQQTLMPFARIRLDPDADAEVYGDIDRFIATKVDELALLQRYPEQLRETVKAVFRDRAQGTFLWVGIVAQVLRKVKKSEVEATLKKFPRGLNGMYGRMLLQIEQDQRDIAAQILRWVVMAARPLTVTDLAAATNVVTSPDEEVMSERISSCGYLLSVSGEHVRTVNLIHQSAKDYLLRKDVDPDPALEAFRVKESTANLEIATKCLNLLQIESVSELAAELPPSSTWYSWGVRHRTESRIEALPLLSYAVQFWIAHVRSLKSSEALFDPSNPCFIKGSPYREAWVKLLKIYGNISLPPVYFHLLCYLGIDPVVSRLLQNKKHGVFGKARVRGYISTGRRWSRRFILG